MSMFIAALPSMLLLLLVAGCGRAPARDTSLAERLAGSWDARLVVEQTGRETKGVVAFTTPTSAAVLNGAYNIDLAPVGFAPAMRPDAVATTVAGDSVQIVLNPRTESQVTMRGAVSGDSVVGTWSAELSRAAGRTGRFVMVRRAR
jgi:hypothetical protein